MVSIKKAQISMEYMMIVGFLTFVLIGVLGVALYNSNSLRDMIQSRQVGSFGNKIISASESAFYSGKPSKITIVVNIPEGISDVNISEDTLFITYQASSGINLVSFPSNVPITGDVSSVSGIRKIQLEAQLNSVVISS